MKESNKKPVLFFFCYRMLEFRMFVNTGILQHCAKDAKVILFVPPELIEAVRDYMPGTTILPLRYPILKGGMHDTKWYDKIEYFLRMIFALTYRIPSDYPICLSQEVHIVPFLSWYSKQSLRGQFIARTVIFIARCASMSRLLRRFLQAAIQKLLHSNAHAEDYQTYNPDLVVVGSSGLDADGYALGDARRMGVRSAVIVQSWDRTVCKGYPTVHPDYVLVWNYHMADECVQYLDYNRDCIFVEGAPVWDYLLRKDGLLPRSEFLQSIGFSEDKPVIYYLMPSAFWHNDLLQSIPLIIAARNSGKIDPSTQIIFRIHPYYHREGKHRNDLMKILDSIDSQEGIYVDLNKIKLKSQNIFLDPADSIFQTNCLYHSDACLSVFSLSLIEAVFCGTPSISLMMGYWRTPQRIQLIKNAVSHHIAQMYSYDLIMQVFSYDELFAILNEKRYQKLWSEQKRLRMLDGEVPIHRGNAAWHYAKRLVALARNA